MSVYDSWHKQHGTDDELCREHSRGRAKLYRSAKHGKGKRWEARYYIDGKQKKKSFRVKEGRNPNVHADAFMALIEHQLDRGDYIDPDSGDITFREFAEDWRKSRTHDTVTAVKLEGRLRNHVYPAIGDRRMRELDRRPSLIADWIKGIRLRESSASLVLRDVSAIFRAAIDDGIVSRDPTRAASVQRPGRGGRKARPWNREQITAMGGHLPPRYAIVPWLGAGTGMRQGEMFGLAADDVVFLGRHPVVHVRRQVKYVSGRPHFAPVKNRKAHDVPLAPSLAPLLAEHMRQFPPAEVTLPWHDLKDPERHGQLVTVRLVLTRPDGRALSGARFNEGAWWPALAKAGIGRGRENGCHVLRHTYASMQLRARVDVARVADAMGDTPQVVWQTYAHLVPEDTKDDMRAAVDAFLAGPEIPAARELPS